MALVAFGGATLRYRILFVPLLPLVLAACDEIRQISDSKHGAYEATMAVLPDGRFVSAVVDHVLVQDPYTGRVQAVLEGHESQVNAVAVLPDGRIVSGSRDHTLRVWDVGTKQCVAVLHHHGHNVTAVAVVSDDIVVSGSRDHTLRVWDLRTGAPPVTLRGHQGPINLGIVCASLGFRRCCRHDDQQAQQQMQLSPGS